MENRLNLTTVFEGLNEKEIKELSAVLDEFTDDQMQLFVDTYNVKGFWNKDQTMMEKANFIPEVI